MMDQFWNFSNQSLSEFPKGSGKASILSSALWIGGLENNDLKTAAMTYRQNGVDFFPGPLDTVTGNSDTSMSRRWNKMWYVSRQEIDAFKNKGTISSNIANWPGNGTTSKHEAHFMAPFIDADHDGVYDPSKGDYPDIKGDEMVWWVVNDKADKHGESKGDPLGVEIHASAYTYDCSEDSALFNSIFFDYNIINRSGTNIDSFYAGIWTDLDIGNPFNDYIGCEPDLNCYFGYNGTADDPNDSSWTSGGIVHITKGYGDNPPVQSVAFMNTSMNKFIAYNNSFSAVGNPDKPLQYYYYLQGKWTNGECMKYGNDGYKGTGGCTDYQFPGDIGDNDTTTWNERNAGDKPGDRRGLASSGPFVLKAGQAKDITIAYTFNQRENGNVLDNYEYMKQNVAKLHKLYDAGPITSSCTTSALAETKEVKDVKLYPNPATSQLNIRWTGTVTSLYVFNSIGEMIYTMHPATGQNNQQIDISGLKAGVYTIRCESPGAISTGRFVKLP
jgi:hypothetical protein